MSRVLAWFSHGAASAVATKIALAEHGDRVVVVSIDTGSEHADNARFRADCERWYGRTIEVIRSEVYRAETISCGFDCVTVEAEWS